MEVIPVGQEPERIKKRLDTLFPKLDEAYPDKVIRGLQKDHKKWAETVTELYRALGYESNTAFLEAYGYTVEHGAGGRPGNDHMAVIEELKKRYPNGSGFRKVNQLMEANPDLASKFKTLNNNANTLFGKSLGDYLKEIGLLGGETSVEDKTEMLARDRQRLEVKIEELKKRYADKPLPTSIPQLKSENQDLKISAIDMKIRNLLGENPVEYLRQTGLLGEKNSITRPVKKKDPNKRYKCDGFYYLAVDDGAKIVHYTGKPDGDSLTIPDELDGLPVVVIGEKAFAGRELPKTVILPQYLREIEADAFNNCNLWEIVFPQSIKTLAALALNDAFDPYDFRCRKVVIRLPEGLETIDYLALNTRFDELYVPESVKSISPGLKNNSNDNQLVGTVVRVKAGSYAEEYFAKKKAILVNWNATEEEIELNRHFQKTILDDGTIQITLTHIGVDFYIKEREAVLQVPEKIGERIVSSFRAYRRSFENLKKLCIPAEIREIVIEQGFEQCHSSQCHITIDEANPYLSTDGQLIFNKEKTQLINWVTSANEYILPDTLEEIAPRAMYLAPVQRVRLPQKLREIGENAFTGTKLHELVLPESVQSIGDRAFYPCPNLQSVAGLDHVLYVGTNAFEEKIYHTLPPRKADEKTLDPDFDVSGTILLRYRGHDKRPQIPAWITTIGPNAFEGCMTVEEIVLPDAVRAIQGSPFEDCYSLRRIALGRSLRIFDSCAFQIYGAKGSLERIDVSPENPWLSSRDGVLFSKNGNVLYHVPDCLPAKKLVLPPELRDIRRGANENNTLEELIFSSRIDLWASNCFSDYHALQKVVFHPDQEQIRIKLDKPGPFDGEIFPGCKKLRTIVWPTYLREIGDRIFASCGLQELILPEGVRTIGKQAFQNSGLQRVKLPKSMETVDEGAFESTPLRELMLYDTFEKGQAPYVRYGSGGAEQYLSRIGLLARENEWMAYRVTVLSAQTGEVLRSIVMPSSNAGMQIGCFTMAWRPGAAFDYQSVDKKFTSFTEGQAAYALDRMLNPEGLTDEKKAEYLRFLKNSSSEYLLECASSGRDREIRAAIELDLIEKDSIDELLKGLDKAQKADTARLLREYGKQKYGFSYEGSNQDRLADAMSKAPAGYFPRERTDFVCKDNLPGGKRDYYGFRFRGQNSEIQRLADYLEREDYTIHPWQTDSSELRLNDSQRVPEIIRYFPLLRAVGFAENWSNNFVEVLFSESGYSEFTEWEEVGMFEGHCDGGDERWAWEQDVTEAGFFHFTWLNSGEPCNILYAFPFEDPWDSLDLVVVIDGFWFAKGEKKCREKTTKKSTPKSVFPREFQVEKLNGVLTLTKYTGRDWQINVPEGIQAIARHAFDSSGKVIITIPKTVESIDRKAFDFCLNIQELSIDFDNPNYYVQESVLFDRQGCLVRCLKGKRGVYLIPESTVSIGEGAFEGCSNLKAVVVPESVKVIGFAAFLNTRSLDLSLPDSLKEIGEWLINYSPTIRVRHWPRELTKALGTCVPTKIFTENASAVPAGLRNVTILPYCSLGEES